MQGFLLKLDFIKKCTFGLRRSFRSLMKVWSRKESLSVQTIQSLLGCIFPQLDNKLLEGREQKFCGEWIMRSL
jgi:hypothetical protein